ncbi:MaoC/PaaZ C-terminal domain-containing protein [Streptomyces sp. XM4193]|uniref:MaoC/PaaZ C-terminal domain-containing protein n=1 Tax=Streptomyces sp. XM4193 TaxID=2929782 RepID=UPI0024A73B20|nr:MaoC/PaaZ C-terminal domain-containing protein [Streptomyces sp. XM4193]
MSAYTTQELTGAPGLAGMYLRAVLPKKGAPRELPDRRLVLRGRTASEKHLAEYARVCGFQEHSVLPATYPHMVAFGPSMALMTAADFPFPLLGLVHVSNTIEQLRPLRAGETLTYQVWAQDLRSHPRGRVFDIRAEADDGTATVWRSTSTYLRRGGDGEEAAGSGRAEPPAASFEDAGLTQEWHVPGSVGRRYASVSGDRNPIHLHPLAARPFGFRSSIAHGMWTKARCLAALSERLPEAYRVEVAFRSPVLLPASVRFAAAQTGRDWHFGLRGASGKEREHLRGSLTALD